MFKCHDTNKFHFRSWPQACWLLSLVALGLNILILKCNMISNIIYWIRSLIYEWNANAAKIEEENPLFEQRLNTALDGLESYYYDHGFNNTESESLSLLNNSIGLSKEIVGNEPITSGFWNSISFFVLH